MTFGVLYIIVTAMFALLTRPTETLSFLVMFTTLPAVGCSVKPIEALGCRVKPIEALGWIVIRLASTFLMTISNGSSIGAL